YEVAFYFLDVDLPFDNIGYSVAYTRCCRVNNILNITPNTNVGNLFTATIPGTFILGASGKNASPVFVLKDTAIVCGGNSFVLDFGANDPDIGDSLSYSFCAAYNGPDLNNPAPPPNQWFPLGYTAPYSGTQPLGPSVTINPVTGIISGIAPNYVGSTMTGDRYVVSVCVNEWRNGQVINTHRKDFILRITDCIPISANPNFSSVTCNGFTVNFTQNSSGGPNQFFWDFGDPASGPANTSTLQNPSHTFTDTGLYNIKLRVSINGQCTDSIIRPMGVYPLFFPGFINSTQLCVNTPIQFTDTSYFRYGNITAWQWNFGDPASGPSNTSTVSNPTHTYTSSGTYPVKLLVTNDKGCIDSITKNITINDNPLLTLLSNDSTYCGLDSLPLNASGTGTYNWTPNTNIINANTANPTVFPTTATWYVASLSDANSCFSKDSVLVTPKFDLSNSMTASAISICEEDTIVLKGFTNKIDHINWQWSPAGSVESPTLDTTRAFPAANTVYTLTTTWGTHCVATATQNITVKPLAVPNAGPDAALCNGQATIQLNASGGDTYQWSPATGLTNPNIPNPIASPDITTTYTVTVGVNGCSKTRVDSMVLTVRTLPAISTTNDTLICIIDTLQLNSTGTGNFVWTPNYNISNTNTASPLVSPDVPTTYYVRLTDNFGCYRDDSVFVDVRTGVALNAGADTTICQTDDITLNPVSDGLYYQWTPSTYLDFDNIKNPVATPLTNITYTVVSSIGKCSNTDDISITVVPYPKPNAGADISICSGFSAQLNATGGTTYAW
ncbi:MAG: PKD domain-containing protein, partial [Ferruginibacter sp.]